MFGLCRYCGDQLPRARRPLEVCAKCEDSPLCDRCGHPRGDHRQVFVQGESRCDRRVGDFQTLTSWPCDCEGFRPIAGSLADAAFTEAATDADVDPLRRPLRVLRRDETYQDAPLQAFTDGASSPDGRGGWAYVVVEDDTEILRGHGSALGVTHQRMEIRAVAEALLAAPRDIPVQVVGDSAYVIECFRKEWHVKWESNGWKNHSKKPVANRDEWERLFAAWRARDAETTWERIKGHNGHQWNEIADALAVEAKGPPL